MPERPERSPSELIAGADLTRTLDALFVNAPLRDYGQRPRVNDFTLPVLGMGYLATYAAAQGFNVGVLDAEASGLGIDRTIQIINGLAPRWVGFNLLAPTYEISARIAARLDQDIRIMVGGHQAKAMPTEILTDARMASCAALVLGEGETRVTELLADHRARADLPGVMWLDPILKAPVIGGAPGNSHHLAPDIDALPYVERRFLAQDPHWDNDRWEANMVGARGCPYNCSFCGAAVSANPDISIRTRDPRNILAEMHELRGAGVTAFRFVDDLFLGARRVIDHMMGVFTTEQVGDWAVWDATGRINVLHRTSDATLDTLADNGLREVALGIESGSERMLTLIDKRIDPAMTHAVVRRLTERGINVKGYFILGFPTETREEIDTTARLVHDLWGLTEPLPGRFRASAFEYRPYPGTPDWHRLMATGRYTADQLLNYSGRALACLVAADRYHHLVTEIRPNLAADRIIVCDRYVASSYVLQRMDGVPIEFIEALNAAADVPDLAVILMVDPTVTARRIRQRGGPHSRFEAGTTTSCIEVDLYRDTIARLAERGYPLLTLDTTNTPPAQVVAAITGRIAQLAGLPRVDTAIT